MTRRHTVETDRPASGFPIGMIDDARYEENVLELQPGDRLYLHSDGLTEELNAHEEEFGDERLFGAVVDGAAMGLSESLDAMVLKVVAWRGEDHLKDDVSILALSVS